MKIESGAPFGFINGSEVEWQRLHHQVFSAVLVGCVALGTREAKKKRE